MCVYVKIVDETGQISEEMQQNISYLLNFSARKIGNRETEMGLTFVSDETIHQINLKYRGINEPTDVISLEYKPTNISVSEELLLEEDSELIEVLRDFDRYIGEIYISVDKALKQSKDYNHSFSRELGFLAVHGFLHINGYDHYTSRKETEMFNLQEEILTAYGLTR